MPKYIYQYKNWPKFEWDSEILLPKLATVRNLQGRLLGEIQQLRFEWKMEAALQTLTIDVVKNSEIEGEILDLGQVRSSIARRLGLEVEGLVPSNRYVDGVVEMTLDATQNVG
ncbi:MAG: DUF4172 domain-containing protein [Bacteroidota bacterium]